MRTLLLLSTIMTVSAQPSGDWWETMQEAGCEWKDEWNHVTRINGKIECPENADQRDAYLYGADLRGAFLEEVILSGADLRGAKLGGAKLGGANLRSANLDRADLEGADLWGADMTALKSVDVDHKTVMFPKEFPKDERDFDRLVYYTKDLLARANAHNLMPQILTSISNEELLAELGKRSGLDCTALADAYQKNSDCCGSSEVDDSISSGGSSEVDDSTSPVQKHAVTIDQQPSGGTYWLGSYISVSVNASGTEPISYQWSKNGIDIDGATDNSFHIAYSTQDVAGDYRVKVTNELGNVFSEVATVELLTPPIIDQQPSGGTFRLGSDISLSVNAVGTEPISYQWSKNRVDIDGATDKSFHIVNSISDVAGDYRVKVTNGGGEVTSEVANVRILIPPTIGTLDDVKEVSIGDNVTITASVSGDGTFSYKWLKNGIIIPGETSNQLTLDNVKLADSGGYSLNVGAVFEGASISSYSNTMLLRVEANSTELGESSASAIKIEGGSGNVRGDSSAVGEDVWLTWIATANGTASFNTIGSSYDTTLVIFDGTTEVARDEDSGGYLTSAIQFNAALDRQYSINIQGVNGAVGDVVITWSLEETLLPVITVQPNDVLVELGANAEMSVTVENESADIQYQWYRDAVKLTGETSSSIVFEAVDEGSIGTYTVKISSGTPDTASYREIISNSAKLTIGDSSEDSNLDFGSIRI